MTGDARVVMFADGSLLDREAGARSVKEGSFDRILHIFDSKNEFVVLKEYAMPVADALQIELANRVGHREGVVERVSFGN